MVEFIIRPIDRWPQEPTRHRARARFKAPYNQTLILLNYELARLGAKRAFIQADVTDRDIRIDGQLRADARPATPRVIIAAETKHGPILMPCDTFDDWQDNIRAIALALEALRAVDRYGVTKRGEQYRGLKQITAGDGPINSDEAAIFIANVTHDRPQRFTAVREMLASPDFFEKCYRAAAKKLHPDVGGDPTEWSKLDRAAVILRTHHAIEAAPS